MVDHFSQVWLLDQTKNLWVDGNNLCFNYSAVDIFESYYGRITKRDVLFPHSTHVLLFTVMVIGSSMSVLIEASITVMSTKSKFYGLSWMRYRINYYGVITCDYGDWIVLLYHVGSHNRLSPISIAASLIVVYWTSDETIPNGIRTPLCCIALRGTCKYVKPNT